MKRPWRKVCHIDTRYTANGGIVWWLTLECGHFLARHGGNPSRAREIKIFEKTRFAPRKVRCVSPECAE